MTPAAILVLNLFVVNFGMCGCRDDGEVGVTVVGFDTVDVVDVVAGSDRPAHFVGCGGAVGVVPAGAGIVLAVAVVGSESGHFGLPDILFTANAAWPYSLHAVFQSRQFKIYII